MDEENKAVLKTILMSLGIAQSDFESVGPLGPRSSEKLVEAQAEILRATKKINSILSNMKSEEK